MRRPCWGSSSSLHCFISFFYPLYHIVCRGGAALAVLLLHKSTGGAGCWAGHIPTHPCHAWLWHPPCQPLTHLLLCCRLVFPLFLPPSNNCRLFSSHPIKPIHKVHSLARGVGGEALGSQQHHVDTGVLQFLEQCLALHPPPLLGRF